MRLVLAFTLLIISGCTTAINSKLEFSDYIEPEDTFLASFQKVKESLDIPVGGFTGFKYYIQCSADCQITHQRPHIKGFYYFEGELKRYFSICCQDALKEFEDIEFEFFDYDNERKKAENLFREAKRAKGEIAILGGRDGDTWEIKIQTANGLVELTRSSSDGIIDRLTDYSGSIGKLKRVIDFFALHSGRNQLGFH